MATGEFRDQLTRIEEKMDCHHRIMTLAINGNPETGAPGLNGRLQAVEADMGTARKILAVSIPGLMALGWDAIKRKFGVT